MKCKILHESRGRIRIHVMQNRVTMAQADLLEYFLNLQDGVREAKVYDRTGDAVILYDMPRDEMVACLAGFSFEKCELEQPDPSARELAHEYQDKLFFTIVWRYTKKLLLPAPVRIALTIIRSIKYIRLAIESLKNRRLQVEVLDAVAIVVSMLRGDFASASSVMFMLKLASLLEEWTYKKSLNDLAQTMRLEVDNVWMRVDGQEVLTPVNQVQMGDEIIVRTGNLIPLDGKVIEGEATVNQATITGESLPVEKKSGSYVYAGTTVEEGECVFVVDKEQGSGKYDRIVRMIEESERLNSETEVRAMNLADRLVPFSLGGTALTWMITRNATKALSILMVDFSCAIKMAMPIAVLSAMRESSRYRITVKGGKFLEAVSEADTIVFDKTGTLTHAQPTVRDVVPFNGNDADEMLRLAACLEEHYPHSLANAVVTAAREKGLMHEEHHTKIEYVVAHGISSIDEGRKVIIGSAHFVFEDEKAVIPEEEKDILDKLPAECSQIYLAIDGILSAVICVEDPLREEAKDVIAKLHEMGIKKVVMMTGDNRMTAKTVAEHVGVDEYHAEVLPEEKAAYVAAERKAGHKVIMIGDGVNDSPALSEADVGIAISDGAALAREIADITIAADDLYCLVTMKEIADRLMRRIDTNYKSIVGFNLALIILGVAGVLPPTTTSVLHNLSTIGFGLHSMTNLLETS
ncbi:MAG: heavy metal translocating P-type ATPase [Lachnospiraceae bacterium]|nr:heavy metal translocating P-type ATPase [Lachnospiraceae bacterium]